MNESLIKIQHLFEADNRIKKEMYNLSPNSNQFTDEESISKYTDKLNDSLIYMFSELKSMAVDIASIKDVLLPKIEELEKTIRSNFYYCGFDFDKLKIFYKNFISDMKPEFINNVKKECVGYKMLKSTNPINSANTINEILHYIHSYVMNNENILQSIPVLAKKENNNNESITIRGSQTELFQKLFDAFPTNLDVGETEIVVLNERKALMMIRDRGHALTIEITINNDVARLEYFIPKICNIDMVNALPGVNKVNSKEIGTTGAIETNINTLNDGLFTFISNVPTDSDMIINPAMFR